MFVSRTVWESGDDEARSNGHATASGWRITQSAKSKKWNWRDNVAFKSVSDNSCRPRITFEIDRPTFSMLFTLTNPFLGGDGGSAGETATHQRDGLSASPTLPVPTLSLFVSSSLLQPHQADIQALIRDCSQVGILGLHGPLMDSLKKSFSTFQKLGSGAVDAPSAVSLATLESHLLCSPLASVTREVNGRQVTPPTFATSNAFSILEEGITQTSDPPVSSLLMPRSPSIQDESLAKVITITPLLDEKISRARLLTEG
ncbi:hypothetical protein Nepgr_018489 [Nepenthes gracilis]|uniref:Uncharacterized protein n=1 Tax=Nepenthes gracilis TaxID=150966 RepID=A0AAD3XTG2_NEPGR|nr:hypothetical protein Nepgr_018489 [Nepenthes gracilis]